MAEARRVKKLWEEDPSSLISRILEEHQLCPDDIREERKRADFHGIGHFICRRCKRRWHSRTSTITIDLKEMTIDKKSMQCDVCLKSYEPYVEEKDMTRVIEEAINRATSEAMEPPPPHERTVREEDLRPVFTRILRVNQLRHEDIRDDFRKKINIHGVGSFECSECPNPSNQLEKHCWTSAFSWLTFDLKERTICKRWIMKCKFCNRSYKPYFDVEDIQHMFELAVISLDPLCKEMEEDASSLIDRLMERHRLCSEDIEDDRKRVDVQGTGSYTCRGCHRHWRSHASYITVDLREKSIYKWRMRCHTCQTDCEPDFGKKDMANMIAQAVSRLTLKTTGISHSTPRKVQEANLSSYLKTIMKEFDIPPAINKISRAKHVKSTKIHIYGNGLFSCAESDPKHPTSRNPFHCWSSKFSWITFDLEERIISKRWLMKCQYCGRAYKPEFELEEAERMFKAALTSLGYKEKGAKTEPPTNIGRKGLEQKKRRDPHKSVLCEKCEWGRGKCWDPRWRKYKIH